MEISKKNLKGNMLSSLFHSKKGKRTRKHQADSGHDEGFNIAPSVSNPPSLVLSTSAPILLEINRGSQKDEPVSSSSLTASQQLQLLTVSSPSLSHEPSRTRSTSRMSSISSLNTNNNNNNNNQSLISLRSAYSNGDDIIYNANPNHHEQAPSIIRSDRVHYYHFETPTHDGASSRFSYNAHQHQLKSSSSSTSSLKDCLNQQHLSSSSSAPRNIPRFSFKRPYFSSSFSNSFHRQKSVISHSSRINDNDISNNNNNRDHSSITSSSHSIRVARSNNKVLFLGRSLPDFETLVYCSACEKWIQSRLRYRSGAMVWLAAFVLLMCTVIFFWIPFYTKYFKDTIHYCPSCGCQIGRHNAL